MSIADLFVIIGIIILVTPSLLGLTVYVPVRMSVIFYGFGSAVFLRGLVVYIKTVSKRNKLGESKIIEYISSQLNDSPDNRVLAEQQFQQYKQRAQKSWVVLIPIFIGGSFIMLSPYLFEQPLLGIIFGSVLFVLAILWSLQEGEKQRNIIFPNSVNSITGTPNNTNAKQISHLDWEADV